MMDENRLVRARMFNPDSKDLIAYKIMLTNTTGTILYM